MRVVLAGMLIAGGLAVAPTSVASAHADPGNCPPVCDRVPDAAWIPPEKVPLNSGYHWPAPAAAAVP
ncbi:MAG: ATPase, partial [Mycobacterium sp.]